MEALNPRKGWRHASTEEVSERVAGRLVRACRERDGRAAGVVDQRCVRRIAERVGLVPDTLRGWVKQHRIDAGQQPGISTRDGKRIKDLEREAKELERGE
jgi:transposase